MKRDFENVVFLSHNSADKPAVEDIQRRLELCQPPLRCWIDKDDLRSRGTWMMQIETILAECESSALFFGPSGRGPIHELERQKLVDRAARQRDSFWLVPVLLPGASKEDVDGFTSLFNWVDFRDGLDSPPALERLAKLLRGEAPGTISADDQITGEPYRGLERFDGEHAEFFFGRDEDIRRLCSTIEKLPFVAVIGASGSGKSSLVRAGLQTKLARSTLPQLSHATTITVLPGSDPLQSLAEQLAAAVIPNGRRDERPARADEYARRFQKHADGLRTLLGSLFTRDDDFVLLLIDQFEEVFTHRRELQDGANTVRHPIEQFLSQLSDLVTHADHRLRLAITLRADFLARCLDFALLRGLLQNERNPQLLLGELSEAALREVIVLPSQHAGAYFEKGLVERILKDVEDQRGSLPLLEHALKELWAKRRGRWLTNDAYDATGGVAGALRKRADKTLSDLTPAQREIAKNIFLRLTTLGEGVSDTRRRVPLQELYPVDPAIHPADVRVMAIAEVIDTLRGKEARLVVTHDDGTVEVTHEALMQRWEQLKSWLDTNRDEKRLHDRLRDAAHEWFATSLDVPDQRDASYLWEGGRLNDSEKLARDHPGILNELERTFLGASIAKREHEGAEEELRRERELQLAHEREKEAEGRAADAQTATKRMARLSKAILCASGVTVLLAIAALWQRNIAVQNVQVARDRLAQTQFVLGEIPYQQRNMDDALLWWTSSLSLSSDTTQQDQLRRLIGAWTRQPQQALLHDSRIVQAAFSPDCHHALTIGDDRTVRIWDVVNGNLVGTPLHHESTVNTAAFSRDGTLVLTGTGTDQGKGVVRIWEVATGQLRGTVDVGPGVLCVAMSPIDNTAITVGWGAKAQLWNLDTQLPIGKPLVHPLSRVNAACFSPDGKHVFTGDASYGDSPGGNVYDWNISSCALVGKPLKHDSAIANIAVSEDGTTLIVATYRSGVQLWDRTSGKRLPQSFKEDAFSQVNGITPIATATGGLLMFGTGSRSRVWDEGGERGVYEPDFQNHQSVLAVALAPDQGIARTITNNGNGIRATVNTWNLLSRGTQADVVKDIGSHDFDKWSDDGCTLVVGYFDGRCELIDILGREGGKRFMTDSRLIFAQYSPDSRTLLTRTQMGSVQLWDVKTGKAKGMLNSIPDKETELLTTFSPNGDLLLTVERRESATAKGTSRVCIWEVASGKQRVNHDFSEQQIIGVAYSTRRQAFLMALVAKDRKGPVHVCDAHTNKDVSVCNIIEWVGGVKFSPDSDRLVTNRGNDRLQSWDLSEGRPTAILIPNPNAGIEGDVSFFEPENRYLISRDSKYVVFKENIKLNNTLNGVIGIIEVRDLDTGDLVGEPIRYSNEITDFSLTPDNKAIFTGCADGTSRLWEIQTGLPLSPVLNDGVTYGEKPKVQCSPDGKSLLTHRGTSIRLWDVATGMQLGPPIVCSDNYKFVKESSRLLTIDGQKIWDVTPYPLIDISDSDRVRLFMELRTGKRIHANSHVTLLSQQEWLERNSKAVKIALPRR